MSDALALSEIDAFYGDSHVLHGVSFHLGEGRLLGTRTSSRPNRRMFPASGRNSPVIRLKSVGLPAPLGPMISRRSPG